MTDANAKQRPPWRPWVNNLSLDALQCAHDLSVFKEETAVQQAMKPSDAVRSVTTEEIEHYREHGWVKLDKFVDPHTLRRLLDLARERIGNDGDKNEGLIQPYFNVG